MKKLFFSFCLALLAVLGLSSCSGSNSPNVGGSDSTLPAAAITNSVVNLKTAALNDKLSAPWSVGFLPDGRMLVTEKAGKLKLLDSQGQMLAEVSGVPAVYSTGQGGLLDVLVQTLSNDTWVYLSYSEPGSGNQIDLAGTAVGKGRLVGNQLTDWQIIFRQQPKVAGGTHFGSRLVFDQQGDLFVTLGDRGQDSTTIPTSENAQNLTRTLGKVVHIKTDGAASADNPSWGTAALAGIYSSGHRNPQGAALHPLTGQLWVAEHGPQGGDEINRAQAGNNYGWPLRSYGCPYGAPVGDTCRIGGGIHAPAFVEPLSTWTPISVAPSSLMIYSGSAFPEWQGHVFMGSLAGKALWRLTYQGDKEISREALLTTLDERIRDVKQGLDGRIYLLTDSGKLLRLERQ
jgi:aldose sugar dehydrogenase